MHDCLISFGSNLGEEAAILQQAIGLLREAAGIEAVQVGDPVRTQPVGGPADQPAYLNAALRVKTTLDEVQLHRLTTEIEQQLGRQRRVRWGARTADLDILLFDQKTVDSEKLIIPHPRMSFRRFVLEPTREIAGNMVHPESGMTIVQLLEHLDQRPRTIVWLGNHNLETNRLVRRLQTNSDEAWKFQLVQTLEELATHSQKAKLVVVDRNWHTDNRGDLPFDLPYRGPLLWLPESAEKVEIELAAAMEAMEPTGR